jgi:hypothetical protein
LELGNVYDDDDEDGLEVVVDGVDFVSDDATLLGPVHDFNALLLLAGD